MLHAVRNHVPMFAGRVVPGTRTDLPQLPAMVTRGKEMMEIFLGRVEPHMARNDFVAGPELTVADITGFFAVRMTSALGIGHSRVVSRRYRLVYQGVGASGLFKSSNV